MNTTNEIVTEQTRFIQGHFQKLKKLKESHIKTFKNHLKTIHLIKEKHLTHLHQSFYYHQDTIALICSLTLSIFSLIMLGNLYLTS